MVLLPANSSTATSILKIKAMLVISTTATFHSAEATAETSSRYVSRSPHIKENIISQDLLGFAV